MEKAKGVPGLYTCTCPETHHKAAADRLYVYTVLARCTIHGYRPGRDEKREDGGDEDDDVKRGYCDSSQFPSTPVRFACN